MNAAAMRYTHGHAMTKVPKQASEIDPDTWAKAHDVGTLQLVRTHRDALRALAPTEVAAALSLARLFDTDGVDADVVSALEAFSASLPEQQRGPVELALARACFERSQISAAHAHLDRAIASTHAEASVSASFALVRVLVLSGEYAEGRAQLERAREKYDACGARWPWVDVLAHSMTCGQHLVDGRKQEALIAAEAALQTALSYHGTEAPLMAGFIGNIEFDLSHWASAERAFATAVKLARTANAVSTEAVFTGYRGWAAQCGGDESRARRFYRAAIALCDEIKLVRFGAQFRALSATAGATARNLEDRELQFRGALAELASTGDSERAEGLGVLQVVFDLQRALRASAQGSPNGVEVFHRVATAYARILAAHENSDDARIAKTRAQEEFDAKLPVLVVDPSPDLALSPGGLNGHGPMGKFSLRSHPALSRMLWALALGWSEDRGVSDTELTECAWPGEQLSDESRIRRLRVAISSLRKRALGDLLARADGGYRLNATSLALVP